MTTHTESKCCDRCIDSRLKTPDEMELYCSNPSCHCHTKQSGWQEDFRFRHFALQAGFVSENDHGELVQYIEGLLTSQKATLVEKIQAKKRAGLEELEDQEVDLDGRPTGAPYTYYSCKECGGYDECDCLSFGGNPTEHCNKGRSNQVALETSTLEEPGLLTK